MLFGSFYHSSIKNKSPLSEKRGIKYISQPNNFEPRWDVILALSLYRRLLGADDGLFNLSRPAFE